MRFTDWSGHVLTGVFEQLARLDAPTGFAVGAHSATATLNNRTECLTALGVLNRVGPKQEGITVADDGTVSIDGTDLAALNAQLHARNAGNLTLLLTAAFCRALGVAYSALSNSSLTLVNPAPVPGLLSVTVRVANTRAWYLPNHVVYTLRVLGTG